MTFVDVVEIHGLSENVASALLARPEPGSHPAPGLLVLHDLYGLDDDLRRIVGRFAEAGYLALAPDYFGAGLRLPCIARAAVSVRRGRGRPFERIREAFDYLGDLEDVDRERRGVVGFCMGGGFAVLWAARSDAQAVATFYGDAPKDAEQLRGIPPCFAGYGARDRIFIGQGRRLRGQMESLGVEHEYHEYPEAGHAYMNQLTGVVAALASRSPMAAGFDPDAAADSWNHMLAFFDQHLG